MRTFLLNTTIAILTFTLWTNILVNPDAQDPVPSRWRKIDAYGKFTFYLPPEMWDTRSHGIENLHGEYTSGRMHLSYDYEPYGYLAYENRALAFGKDFQEIELQVDGKKSFLFIYQDFDRKKRRTYNANLYVGDIPNQAPILSMHVSSRSARYIETAKTIFRTIKFLPSKP